ncbi:MAG: polyphosphate kinase 1 [Thermoanaerobaculales bacterium]
MSAAKSKKMITGDSPDAFVNRELSWLRFARRVLELVQDPEVPLLERVKFAGILGMLHDEFFMKRIAGLKRQVQNGVEKISIDGLTPAEELAACREEILGQSEALACSFREDLRPALVEAGIGIVDWNDLGDHHRADLSNYVKRSVLPIITPLAVDAEHPFPFISNSGINIAVTLREGKKKERFVRIEAPSNRNRWVPLSDGSGFVPLEQVIGANLGLFFPDADVTWNVFRVTRAARGEDNRHENSGDADGALEPGSIIRQVTDELKARKFAGKVRLQVGSDASKKMRQWLVQQLHIEDTDVYVTDHPLRIADLMDFRPDAGAELHYPPHTPVTHGRLRNLQSNDSSAIFEEIRRGDILLHHPYHSFDTSVVQFLRSAAVDEHVLAIKLTIYRTSSDSPIAKALVEAARRGKQVAVLVEITARFDEAPNIAWGRLLEQEGVHVCYGVEKLKTHVKLAMVVREEADGVRRYVHVGTGNYHSGTARVYEDLGLLSCNPDLTADVAAVFNELTSSTPFDGYTKLLVAPHNMRGRFLELIRREAEHAGAGRAAGIRAKMNQLQDPEIIRELYRASQAGVPITLNIRGLCCLRPGIPGLSDTIQVFSVLGRFLEHGRIYGFENDGSPEYFFGSADWMKRNLDRRVETISPVDEPTLIADVEEILTVAENDNHSAWDMQPDGTYVRRRPAEGEDPRPSQQAFIDLVR